MSSCADCQFLFECVCAVDEDDKFFGDAFVVERVHTCDSELLGMAVYKVWIRSYDGHIRMEVMNKTELSYVIALARDGLPLAFLSQGLFNMQIWKVLCLR